MNKKTHQGDDELFKDQLEAVKKLSELLGRHESGSKAAKIIVTVDTIGSRPWSHRPSAPEIVTSCGIVRVLGILSSLARAMARITRRRAHNWLGPGGREKRIFLVG